MRKNIICVLLFCLVLLFAAGCSSQEKAPVAKEEKPAEPVTVTVTGLKGPTSIGLVHMIEYQPKLGENISVTYDVAPTPDVLSAKLLKKEVDFATLPTNVAANLYNKGIDYKLIAMNTWGNLYIVSNGVEIKDWSDLKGKDFNAINRGSTPDIVLQYLLNENGIDPQKDINLDYSMNHVELANAMIANKANLGILPEPFATMVTMRNPEVKIMMSLEDEWKKIQGPDSSIAQGCMLVSNEFLNKHPQIVEEFLKEYAASINWVNQNLAEAGVLVEKHDLGMQAKIAEKAIPRSNIRFATAQEAKGALDKYYQVLLQFSPESVGGKLPDEGFYYKK